MKLQRKVYTTRQEKIIDLVIGIGVFMLVNVFMTGIGFGWTAVETAYSESIPSFVTQAVSLILTVSPYILNLGLLVLFALWRHWIALGMVAAFAISLLLALCLAVIAGVACLWLLGGFGQ